MAIGWTARTSLIHPGVSKNASGQTSSASGKAGTSGRAAGRTGGSYAVEHAEAVPAASMNAKVDANNCKRLVRLMDDLTHDRSGEFPPA
jgi:hypothetical protein